MINHPEQLIAAVCRIKCGDDHGTGFFISSNIIMTANHTLMDYDMDEEIIITLQDNSVHTASILAQDEDLDVALIQLTFEIQHSLTLKIALGKIRYNEEWSTFGYPFSKLVQGQLFIGTVQAYARDLPYDLSLTSGEIDTNTDYSGLSGSPLIVDGRVNGIITWSTFRGLGAVSITKMKDFLDKYEIAYENLFDGPWTEEYQNELERAVENNSVIALLKDSLEEKGKYHLLYGSPGSGKSVISSLVEPKSPDTRILGRYLLRTPGDKVPIYVKASKENFMQWLEDLVSEYSIGEPVARSDMKWNDRVTRLYSMLDQTNTKLLLNGESLVIVVDGLDEVVSMGKEGLADFLSMLPENLPSNISILLSCTSEEILPVFIKSRLNESNKVHVTPLDRELTEKFLTQENQRRNLGLSVVQQAHLTAKSEGHPLYLHYILETLTSVEITGRDEWIEALPSIAGDIKNYYEAIWSKYIGINSSAYWISLIGSQLRQPVEQGEFKKMLPDEVQLKFQTEFVGIKHLFKFGKKIAIYHQSFENFISVKGEGDLLTANGYISAYNIKNENSNYALRNILHHMLRSEDPLQAITRCDQKWADDCALIHMEPDLIIGDVERVEELCIDKHVITELVRIKLLLQRLRFRYNTILANYTFDLADALINMGESGAALRYIIREDLLLISIEDSLHFLQKFFDIGAELEASKLAIAVQLRFKILVEKSVTRGGMDISIFNSQLRFNAICITRDNFHSTLIKYAAGAKILKEISEDSREDPETQIAAKEISEDLEAYTVASFIYRLDSYPGIEQLSKLSSGVYSANTAFVFARTALFYQNFAEQSAKIMKESKSYRQLIADIELLVKDYGYNDDDIEGLLLVLLKKSRNSPLLEEMINKKLAAPAKFNLRMGNGVDPDMESINLYYQDYTYRGYIDKSNAFPVLIQLKSKDWEKYIISMHELCGFLQGKLYRANSEKNYEIVPLLKDKAREIFEALNFHLKERCRLDRSYYLIEDIVPLLYHRLLLIFLDLDDDSINWFVERIINPKNVQLGMYTEGYRRALFELSKELTKLNKQRTNAFKLIKSLEDHVYVAVQNRWEKIPELIEIVGFYAKIGAKSKAWSVYQKMLNTSMGPTWYKEDQFGLINSSLRSMEYPTALVHYADFASQLEYASGEMTFQRYTQSAMSSFTGTMAKAGQMSRAIEYFKFLVLPAAQTILENAESSTLDAPVIGDGYIFGARAIIEAEAMGHILLEAHGDPMLIFGLSEIFILSDDTDRYINRFTKIQYKAYLSAKETSENYSEEILNRIVALLKHDRFKKEESLYLKSLYRNFETDLEKLEENLIGAGWQKNILPDIPQRPALSKTFTKEDDEILEKIGGRIPGTGKMNNFSQIAVAIEEAEIEFAMENMDEGFQKLLNCLHILATDETDIWAGGHLTKDLESVFKLFIEHASKGEMISFLKPFIMKHLTDDWRVITSLLELLSAKLETSEKEAVIINVKEHIDQIIQSAGTFRQKYDWLSVQEDSEKNPDELLLEFLIWLFNHPFESIRQNVLETLHWLSAKKSSLVIPQLIQASLTGQSKISAEYATYLLKEISGSHAGDIWDCIDTNDGIQTAVISVDHTMQQIYWRKILQNCAATNKDAQPLLDRSNAFFASECFKGRDIYIEDGLFVEVSTVLDELNELSLLDREFMKSFEQQRSILREGLSAEEHERVGRYITRSFPGEEIEMGYIKYTLLTALNITLSGRVAPEQIEHVTSILQIKGLN